MLPPFQKMQTQFVQQVERYHSKYSLAEKSVKIPTFKLKPSSF